MGKKDSKHKKSSHKKKHKKEKKRHKEKKSKHHRRNTDSSDSDSSSTTSSYDSDREKRPQVKHTPEKLTYNKCDSGWDDLFSDRYATVKEKNVKKKSDRDILDKPGQSARELNPYWKDGGNGLPPTKEEILSKQRNNDINYLKNLLQKARQIASETGDSVEQIILEEWGPLDKLKQIIEENEKQKSGRVGMFQKPSSPTEIERRSDRHMGFMKPSESSESEFKNSYKRNWQKKGATPAEEVVGHLTSSDKQAAEESKIEQKPILSADELNALVAKAMKAEIMGNKALSEQLKKEIEEAKKNKENAARSGGGGGKTEQRKEEVIILTKMNSKGFSKPCDSSEYSVSEGGRKKKRGETHKGNERVRYFLDDDKHSLKTMFENEKFSTPGQSDEMFLKMAKKGKLHSNNEDNDLDDMFLDRVRGSDYERKESERERNRTLNEAKAQHKSLSSCRWCLDGNNVDKHLIISVGSKCYICLPSDESLTKGHCLIVPIHHDTCGTQLDEDVWNEMQMFRKNLVRMFADDGEDVVFFENARSFHRYPHMVLHCVPIEKEVGDLAPIYFKKAIMDSETEWSNNKKVIDLKSKGLRRSVPKGLPYFAVDFGLENGFAHVIEDEQLFPHNFAEEIIGGMLDLDSQKWRKKRKESIENQKEKASEFMERWKKYDCMQSRKRPRHKSDSSSSD